jgi:hypothetical protein
VLLTCVHATRLSQEFVSGWEGTLRAILPAANDVHRIIQGFCRSPESETLDFLPRLPRHKIVSQGHYFPLRRHEHNEFRHRS